MKIIVVGAGEIGRHLAERLSREANEVIVIEEDDRLARDLEQQLDAKVIHGDGSSVSLLLEAGLDQCGLFMALTTSNSTNLICSSIAKKLGAAQVVCRVHPSIQREEPFFNFRGEFNIDFIFSSERLAALELSKYIRNPDSLFVEEIARGKIEIQQLALGEHCAASGETLESLKLPERVRIGAVQRGNKVLIPTAKDKLQAGDLVTLIGNPHRLQEVAGKLGQNVKRDTMRVVIFGGGEYGTALAQMLAPWRCRVRILDHDPVRCQEISDLLDGTDIINMDATSLSAMREERIGEADFFVATTSSDEDNVMTCLQAHNLGAKHCLTLIHRADYADAISSIGEKIGIMAAVSPREAVRQQLMRFVTANRHHVVKRLHRAEVIEATVTEEAALANRQVSEITWPSGSLLVAQLRGEQASVPAAADVIEPGDTLYAIVAEQAKKEFLRLFKKSKLAAS